MGVAQFFTVTAIVRHSHDEAAGVAGEIRDMLRALDDHPEIGWMLEEGAAANLLEGPTNGLTNGVQTYALVTDGSNRGWNMADAVDPIRQAFIERFDALHVLVQGVSTGDNGTYVLTDHGVDEGPLVWHRVGD